MDAETTRPPAKMHADEVHTDVELVRLLLADHFPHWAELPIERVASAGTDNAIYRLGEEMAVRLPRIGWAMGLVDKEYEWLPKLAPHLPLAIPVPLAKGNPGEGYPWHWSVCRWLDGEDATVARLDDLRQAALELARFLAALQQVDARGGHAAGRRNFYRGVPLAMRDADVRKAIPAWRDIVDTDALTAAWEAALAAPAWARPGVWVHGDLFPGNLLVNDGRLSAVIDFGCLGVGDPACDLTPAWTMFSSESRDILREALALDDATWARGRGWALMGVGALPYYRDTNPGLVAQVRRGIEEVLADHAL